MSYGIRTGKYGARLTVLSMAIAEKQRIRRRIITPQTACLADETAGESNTVFNARAA